MALSWSRLDRELAGSRNNYHCPTFSRYLVQLEDAVPSGDLILYPKASMDISRDFPRCFSPHFRACICIPRPYHLGLALQSGPQKADKCLYSHLSSPIDPLKSCFLFKGRTLVEAKFTISLANVRKGRGDHQPVIPFKEFEPQSPLFGSR